MYKLKTTIYIMPLMRFQQLCRTQLRYEMKYKFQLHEWNIGIQQLSNKNIKSDARRLL